jgi:hypothetical protein
MRTPNSEVDHAAGELRYARQHAVLPRARRQSTAVAVLGAETNEVATRVVAAGLTAMGITHFACDFPGSAEGGRHWFLDSLPGLVQALHPDAEYHCLDPEFPAGDLSFAGGENHWIVQWANDPGAAAVSLSDLASKSIDVPTIIAVCTHTGVLVHRFSSPAAALTEIYAAAQTGRWEAAPPGPPELSVLAGGLIVHEVMLGTDRLRNSPGSHLVGFYSLNQPRRTMPGSAAFVDLTAQILKPPTGPTTTLGGRRYTMVGAGAMGTWVGLIAALEGRVQLDLYDGDVIEVTNLNRQVLFVRVEPRARKALVLARELASMDPQGSYLGTPKYITSASDLEHVTESQALICAPDNDATRLLCADAARTHQVLFATGGSSPAGGQVVVTSPTGPCFRCVTGYRADTASGPGGGQSCARAANDAVVSSNMIVAGLLLSELRAALAGQPTANIRFEGDTLSGNRLARMVSQVRCPHRGGPTDHHDGA